VNPAPFFSVESDTMGTLRVSGAISFANAARALTQVPQAPRAGAMEIDLSAGKLGQCDAGGSYRVGRGGQQARRNAALSARAARAAQPGAAMRCGRLAGFDLTAI